MQHSAAKITVGWRERIDLPDWGLKGVRAKIDTGAKTSAIDVAEIEELPNGDIRFEVVGRQKPVRRTKWVTATPVRTAMVKPSHGEPQKRFVCLTPIRIGDRTHDVEISLVCRRNMLCRMLVGRSALEGYYVVDPQSTYLCGRAPKRRSEGVGP